MFPPLFVVLGRNDNLLVDTLFIDEQFIHNTSIAHSLILRTEENKTKKKDTLSSSTRNQVLTSVHLHILLQQRDHVGIEGLPVGVPQVVFLGVLVEIALDDGKVLLVEDGLHDEPGEGLFVFGVDIGGFDEFGVQLIDAFLVRFGAEVCSKGVFQLALCMYVYTVCDVRG